MNTFPLSGAQSRNGTVLRPFEDFATRLLGRLFAPVDIASLIVFRVGFGLISVWWAVDYIVRGRMQAAYLLPRFHFTYYGFDWVQPWPGVGLYLHFLALAVAGAAIAVGFLYRAATFVFAAGVTYVFLLERTNYQNHYYLLVLVSWLLVLLPLNRLWSVDVLEDGVRGKPTVPAWMLWLARFHIALPYVFGGIAKFEADWFAGAPLRQTLAEHAWWPLLGPWLCEEWVVQIFIYGGLLLDLLAVPLLLWKPTRIVAYLLCMAFHLLNSQLFSIHIFPWFMMLATTLFFEPDWPRRLLNVQAPQMASPPQISWGQLMRRQRAGLVLVCAYCLFHVVWPLRHHVYPGPASWTEQGHYFAWRMMLRGKIVGIRYYLTDPATGQTQIPDLRTILSPLQTSTFPRDPEMILHLAHHIAHEYRRHFGRDVEVRALVLTSLNGRKPQLQIDPTVDLAKIPRGPFHRRDWIVPLSEPLPNQPWTVPIQEWEQHVAIPPLPFMQSLSRRSQAIPERPPDHHNRE